MYEFELNMSREFQNSNCKDEWGCAFCWIEGSELGCEYNYYIDGDIDGSAIYLFYDDGKYMWTNTDCFYPYEIEWDKEDWADRLKAEMMSFLKEEITREWYYV